MLSDEEKKAIEYLKRHILPYYGRKGTIEFMLNDTILNLIEKQSKETKELKLKIGDEKTFIQLGECIGEKKVIDKIKAKIEEVKDGTYDAKIVLQSLLEKE